MHANDRDIMPTKISIEHRNGDLFENVPPVTVFVHACNCKGHWGKGIALEFQKRFPTAFEAQRYYCSQHKFEEILGKSMLFSLPNSEGPLGPGRHFVACLFNKPEPGPARSEKEILGVLSATKLAMQNLIDGLRDRDLAQIEELRMPKLNSGLFNVPWERTLEVLNELVLPSQTSNAEFPKVVVYTL